MRVFGVLAILVLTALAGCSDGGSSDPMESSDLTIDVPKAKAGKGVLVGVVVDATITPVAQATVALTSGQETMTNDEGAFAFSDLEPGTVFLKVSKPGYFETQQSAEVQADVADPPVVKVLLEVNAEAMPYFQELVFKGFLECSTTVIALCAVPEIVGIQMNDEFIAYHDLAGPDPEHIQSEMIWESTQELSDRLWLWHSHGPGEGRYGGSISHITGKSPLLIETNETEIQEMRPDPLPDTWQLVIRVFSGDIEGTTPPMCVVFCNGPGVSINQEFEVFTHNFYNYKPPEEWRFSEGPVPAPQ